MSAPERPEGWAEPVEKIDTSQASDADEAVNLNLEGRQLANPLSGFGWLWRKTYRVRLGERAGSPESVMAIWKANFPDFQPPGNRFYPPKEGIRPGAVFLINADTPGGAIYTGMIVLHVDGGSLTLITPEGHPEAGYITFSAFEQDGATVAQVQSLARASDPLYELAYRLVGAKVQENIWRHTLRSLAAHFGSQAPISIRREVVDRRLQWRQAFNLRHNAQIRSLLYRAAAPLRTLRDRRRRTDHA